MSIVGLSAVDLLETMRSGDISAVDVTTAHLDVIAKREPEVHAFLHIDSDGALAQAEVVDRKRKAGGTLGSLAGIPVAIKDVICTVGQPTTCGSKMLENYRSPFDAYVIERLRAADAVLIGKTNLDEFAMGSSTENSAYQPTCNPWDLSKTPGGSSGGSAAAVAAEMVPLSLGTDTGGSIRQPAGFCGIVGMKPTYGRVSRYGLVAFASSLDQIGPMAHDTRDAALLLEAIAGHDRRDTTSIPQPVPSYSANLEEPLKDLKIGVPFQHFGEGLDSEVSDAVNASLDAYQQLGATVVEISLPYLSYSVAAYYLIAPSEASSNLARYDGVHYGHRAKDFDDLIDMYAASRGEGFGSEVKRRIMLGTYALSAGYYDAYYLKALKVRRLIRNDFDKAFEEVDIIASPVSPTPAFNLGEFANDPLAMYLADIFTLSGNLAGIPGMSIPAGFSSKGLPIGLQLQGPPLSEDKLLRVARMYERESDWKQKRPLLS
ncbi:MAG: Asp-tRNA(Asn)/Glu-tRNA(Gln) amidotransferase subunit GatA [Planctomycetota bacterium]|nr:Asp-tRNA(Asn)/Glu-tRNA(Gln) amidotransferase subunit GatA [Planctomycetota bacterium]